MKTQRWLLLVSGVGLILLGLFATYLLQRRQADNVLQPSDFSALPVPVHYRAPEIALHGLDGQTHRLSDYRGRVALVNLWATWCPPCQAELPVLQKYYVSHESEGFTVIAVEDGESEADVSEFARRYGLTFEIWLDPQRQAADAVFKTANLPTSYVIDKAGNIRLTWLGAISAENLEKYVSPIVRER